jgi:hypothetical protein
MIRSVAILGLTALALTACATSPVNTPVTVAELTAQCDALGGTLVARDRDARRGGGDYVCRSGGAHVRQRRTQLNIAVDQSIRSGG